MNFICCALSHNMLFVFPYFMNYFVLCIASILYIIINMYNTYTVKFLSLFSILKTYTVKLLFLFFFILFRYSWIFFVMYFNEYEHFYLDIFINMYNTYTQYSYSNSLLKHGCLASTHNTINFHFKKFTKCLWVSLLNPSNRSLASLEPIIYHVS